MASTRAPVPDITTFEVDAVVNSRSSGSLRGGRVREAIFTAAGVGLEEACQTLSPRQTGEARITLGLKLPAKYIIHALGTVWHGGIRGERG